MTDHQALVNALAARQRRYAIDVSHVGSTITDEGVRSGRFARATTFDFNNNGELIRTNRLWKAAWLARGTQLKIWG